eukprot:TRINITY_DN54839_c0_g1_i1.p1 TRINITY_DN54839_c0_g1~~TRINITY_DN54839_c0_g1_i1.p1  ORF type:complete len:312 (+),score=60.13 TRINITY_DN54839_c0_g1_i1:77-1012(+)
MVAGCERCGHSDSRKRPPPEPENVLRAKLRRSSTADGDVSTRESVVTSSNVAEAAAAFVGDGISAALVQRSLSKDMLLRFAEYVESCPRWPDVEDYHPLEATWDRVALIEFSDATFGKSKDISLNTARGYGKNLPPRNSIATASAFSAIEEVVRVLPRDLQAVVANDAEELLHSLHNGTGWSIYQLRLELVLGDTCQRWHCDANISRSIVTYAGPGTWFADERAVTRDLQGNVNFVRDGDTSALLSRVEGDGTSPIASKLVIQACVGDMLLMKGSTWPGFDMQGLAHRAPPIGPVTQCSKWRLVMKVDIFE